MSKMAKLAEAKRQGDNITVEYFGLPLLASGAEAGMAVDLCIGVKEYMAYQDEDDDDYPQDDDDLSEDDLDEDDEDEDEDEAEDEAEPDEGELDQWTGCGISMR